LKKGPSTEDLSTAKRTDSQGLSRGSGRAVSLDSAQELAIGALLFLAADPERFGCFAASSGVDPGNLRAAAQSPEFLAAILDYMASDESLLLAFAAESGRDPADVQRARIVLSPQLEE
jgi:hypothetical protein